MSTPRSQHPLSVCVSLTVDCVPDLTSAIEVSIVRSVIVTAGIVAAQQPTISAELPSMCATPYERGVVD